VRFGVNLRGDLAKLSDDELADHLQSSLDRREALAARFDDTGPWQYRYGFMMPFGRGLLHARILYRIMAAWCDGPLTGRSLGDLYMLDCEIKDLRDEMRRRVKARRAERGLPS
jgi:hypothetical protein